jgi:hypothetical protein
VDTRRPAFEGLKLPSSAYQKRRHVIAEADGGRAIIVFVVSVAALVLPFIGADRPRCGGVCRSWCRMMGPRAGLVVRMAGQGGRCRRRCGDMRFGGP